jgi:drug/metabolite transporter (DMT)-like permease
MKEITVYPIFFLSLLIYSSIFVVLKPLVDTIDPLTVTVLRTVLPAVFVPLLLLIRKPDKIKNKKHIIYFIIGSMGHMVLYPILSSYGLKLTTAARSGIILSLIPVFCIIISFFILKEKISLNKIIGVGIGFAGILLLISQQFTAHSLLYGGWKGETLLVLSALSSSITYIMNGILIRHYSSWTVINYYLLFSGLIYIPFLFNAHGITDLNHLDWIRILYLGFIGVFLANALSVWVTKFVSVIFLSLQNYLITFMGILWAIIFLGEKLTLIDVISGIIILCGVILVKRNPISKNKIKNKSVNVEVSQK